MRIKCGFWLKTSALLLAMVCVVAFGLGQNVFSLEAPNTSDTSSNDVEIDCSKFLWTTNYLSTMPSSAKNNGLKILLPRELHTTEQMMLDDFVKKTGCKVTEVITTEKEYTTKLVSMISSQNSPDIFMVSSNCFPSAITKAMQPLDAKTFHLDDNCWDKEVMNAFSINGIRFAVAMRGSWQCEQGNYVTYYQPAVLRACGVTSTPYDLYREGKWNWNAQYEIASRVKAAGKGYIGISLQSYDLFMLSAGKDFVTYDGKQFKNELDGVTNSSLLTKAWQSAAKLNENNISEAWNLPHVLQGEVGLFTAKAYGMYKESDWGFKDMPGGANSIEVVPVAGPSQSNAYTPYNLSAWGVPKGAKNVEGAAYFLRYWLDADNCDMNSTFLNAKSKEVYKIITAEDHKRQPIFGRGVVDYVTSGSYDSVCSALYQSTSANVVTILNSKKGQVNAGVTRVNKDLERIKCEHSYVDSCDATCNKCGAERTAPHSYKTTTTKATTSKNGSVVKTCSVCGEVYSSKTVYYAKTFNLSTTSYTYNGKVKTPSVTVKDTKGNTLKKDTDYTVSYPSGRKNIGSYKVKITLKGNYTGTKYLTFTINPKIKLSTTKYTYNGKVKKPSVKVTNSSGSKISTKYYSVSYSSGRKKVGTYTITVKFKNGHSGSYKQTFTIVPKGTSVSKLTAGKKSLKVSIKKQSSQTTGYEIQYSTSKKFSSKYTKSTTVSYKTTSKTLKSLSAKKTYYVRVRTYKTVSGKKYYSGWSTVKYKKTK